MRILLITLLLISSLSSSFATEVHSVKEFKIEKKTIQEAIKDLNVLIWKKYPDRQDLLVAYVEQPFPNYSFDTLEVVPKKEKRFSLDLTNNPPINVIVHQLAQISNYHFRIHGTQIVVYGWHLGDME